MTYTFDKNQVIFRQDTYESWMYDILRGSVAIYTGYGTKDAQLITTMEAGKCFGEIGLIGVYPRSATAVALEDGVVLERLTSENITAYFKDEPEKVLAILRVMTDRLRGITGDYREACRTIAQASGEKRTLGRIGDALGRKLRAYARMLPSLPDLTARSAAQAADQEEGLKIPMKPGDVLFREGDAADAMYSVCFGRMGVYTDYGTPQEKLINTLSENDMFGEMGLVDNLPRSATVVALAPSMVVEVITRDGFEAAFIDQPVRVLMLMQQLSERIRRMTERYVEACRLIANAEAEKAQEDAWTSDAVLRYIDMNRRYIDEDMYCL